MDARTANQIQILSLAGSPVISFRCECGDGDCRRTIPLSPASYREHRAHDDPVLYPGHEVHAAADLPEEEPLAAERDLDWLERLWEAS